MKLIDNTGLSYLIGKMKTMIGLKADKTYVDNKVNTLEAQVSWLMYRVFDDLTSNPFMMTFSDLDGLTVTGIWNEAKARIEC